MLARLRWRIWRRLRQRCVFGPRASKRLRVHTRQRGLCFYCGRKTAVFVLDHLMPRSRGDNMVERDMGDNSQMFIDGYFSCLLSSGHRPNYGCPQNHLPDVREHEVRVRPGFHRALSVFLGSAGEAEDLPGSWGAVGAWRKQGGTSLSVRRCLDCVCGQ